MLTLSMDMLRWSASEAPLSLPLRLSMSLTGPKLASRRVPSAPGP